MKVRLTATMIGLLSLVWAGIGLYIVKLALEPRGEPDDAAVLFVPILTLAVIGFALSARTVIVRRGILPLGIFAAALGAATALNTVIVPFADYGAWTTLDMVTWLLGGANTLVLALASWILCRPAPT